MALANSPVFTNSTLARPFILQTNAKQPVRYRLLSPQETYFKVEPNSGALKVAGTIGHEMVGCCFYSFDSKMDLQHEKWEVGVIAHNTDPSNPLSSQPIQVEIEMLDEKNKTPALERDPFEFELLLPTARGKKFVSSLLFNLPRI